MPLSFLRRQKLWRDDLTQEQASQLIGDILAVKRAGTPAEPGWEDYHRLPLSTEGRLLWIVWATAFP
jgi:hypothetical protein